MNINYFIREKYLSVHVVDLDLADRTAVVKFFMDLFKIKQYSPYEIGIITRFLKRKGLTRAERHAVILHLGYRYASAPDGHMGNLVIDGYYNHQGRKKTR